MKKQDKIMDCYTAMCRKASASYNKYKEELAEYGPACASESHWYKTFCTDSDMAIALGWVLDIGECAVWGQIDKYAEEAQS